MHTKTIVRLAIPVVAGALLLTGCGGGSGGGDTIKIAYQGPLSGDNAQLGTNMERGIQLAIQEANESGDYDFELEYFPSDDGGDDTLAIPAAQRVIDDTSVVAVIGPAFSGPAAVSSPLYGEAGMAAVSSSATLPELTAQGFPTFLRAVPNDNAQGAAMGEFLAAQEGVESVVVIDDVTPYGEGLGDVAEATLRDAGLTVHREPVPADTVDYGNAARTVVSSGADAVIYAGYYSATAPLAEKLDEAGFDGIAVSGDGTNDPEFVRLAGDSSENWYMTCPCTDPNKNQATKDFAERYQAEFDAAPGTYSAESYDVANMIIQAIDRLGGAPERQELYDELSGGEYEGLTKTFSFDDKGEFTNDTIYFYQVEGGEIGYLGETSELTGS